MDCQLFVAKSFSFQKKLKVGQVVAKVDLIEPDKHLQQELLSVIHGNSREVICKQHELASELLEV